MRMNVTKKIGKKEYVFQVEGDNLFDLVQESQKLSFYDVGKCGLCGSENLSLRSHIAQNKYKYVAITCLECKGQVVFGRKTEEPNTYYLRKNKETKKLDWNKFEKEEKQEKQNKPWDAEEENT